MNEDNIATHDSPAWIDRANFLIVADLSDHGMKGRTEQIWARKIDADKFEVCCIPFFTYGIALGDVVVVSLGEERMYTIERVVENSGRRVYRLWLKGVGESERATIEKFLCDQSLLFERYSANLLSIDAPKSLDTIERIQSFLRDFSERTGAPVENGN
ncbi:MAG: DUF4265 domain-containing protein [Byssovorax sp.]